MKIIVQNSNYYYAIDIENSRWSDKRATPAKALDTIQSERFSNSAITSCRSEEEILNRLKGYPGYTLVEFISDEPTSYEFW
jgi:hypothetical protein